MRFQVSAIVVGLCCMPLGMSGANPGAPDTKPPHTLHAATAGNDAASDAAARHAKRTACLKEARAKKLVAAVRSQYVKDCLDTP